VSLFEKLGIARQLELLGAMRLNVMALPQSTDRGLAESLVRRHEPATPMRHSFRLGLQSRVNDRFDAIRAVSRFAAAAGRDLPQAVQTCVGEALAPQTAPSYD